MLKGLRIYSYACTTLKSADLLKTRGLSWLAFRHHVKHRSTDQAPRSKTLTPPSALTKNKYSHSSTLLPIRPPSVLLPIPSPFNPSPVASSTSSSQPPPLLTCNIPLTSLATPVSSPRREIICRARWAREVVRVAWWCSSGVGACGEWRGARRGGSRERVRRVA